MWLRMRRAADHPAATRQQLLAAGAVVFAARGFREATVREICRQAGSNVAAVNYHFGGKDGLYAEVLAEGQRRMHGPIPVPAVGNGSATERLEEFVRGFLERVLTESSESCHAQLMFRELIEPTAALDRVVAEFIRPGAVALGEIVDELLGPGFTVRERQRVGLSIVSQILNYKHCRPVIERLFPDLPMDAGQIESLTRHITDFSVAAIQGLRRARARAESQAQAQAGGGKLKPPGRARRNGK